MTVGTSLAAQLTLVSRALGPRTIAGTLLVLVSVVVITTTQKAGAAEKKPLAEAGSGQPGHASEVESI